MPGPIHPAFLFYNNLFSFTIKRSMCCGIPSDDFVKAYNRDRFILYSVSEAPESYDEREVFKDIIGYEGLYAISSYGRVYGYNKRIVLKTFKANGDYISLKLSKNNLKMHFKISRLVAIHYIENPEIKPEVNHLKGKDVNYYKELEWATPKENIGHAFATGLANSEHCSHKVKCVHIQTGHEHRFKSIREAERELKIGGGFGSAVIKGKYKSAKGYTFEKI